MQVLFWRQSHICSLFQWRGAFYLSILNATIKYLPVKVNILGIIANFICLKTSLSIIKFDSLKACKSYNMYGLGTSHVISCMHNPWGNKSGDMLLCDVLVICTLMHKGCSVCYSSQSYLQWLSCNCSIDKLLPTQHVEDFHVQLIACFSALRFPETNNLMIEKIYCLWYLHKLLNDETFLVVRIKMLMTW